MDTLFAHAREHKMHNLLTSLLNGNAGLDGSLIVD